MHHAIICPPSSTRCAQQYQQPVSYPWADPVAPGSHILQNRTDTAAEQAREATARAIINPSPLHALVLWNLERQAVIQQHFS